MMNRVWSLFQVHGTREQHRRGQRDLHSDCLLPLQAPRCQSPASQPASQPAPATPWGPIHCHGHIIAQSVALHMPSRGLLAVVLGRWESPGRSGGELRVRHQRGAVDPRQWRCNGRRSLCGAVPGRVGVCVGGGVGVGVGGGGGIFVLPRLHPQQTGGKASSCGWQPAVCEKTKRGQKGGGGMAGGASAEIAARVPGPGVHQAATPDGILRGALGPGRGRRQADQLYLVWRHCPPDSSH